MPPVDPSGTSLINLGELAKPAVVLIEKISDAVGGIAKPWQIQRVASAEAKVDLIRTQTRLDISELEERALRRMIKEEGNKQENIESITGKSIPLLKSDAKPENISNDWITSFFDKGRLVSDQEMQQIWASMLAEEANNPGTFSKKTVDLVSTLDNYDANLFTKLCAFAWEFGELSPFIFDTSIPNEFDNDINFSSLQHLDVLGFIKFQSVGGFIRKGLPEVFLSSYYGKIVAIHMPENIVEVETGHVMLTAAGSQLAKICGSQPKAAFFDFVIQKWTDLNYRPYEMIHRIESWY